jgi:hypothetical protein
LLEVVQGEMFRYGTVPGNEEYEEKTHPDLPVTNLYCRYTIDAEHSLIAAR